MPLHDYKLFWCEQKGIRMGCSCGMLLWEVLPSRSCKTLYKVLVSRSCKILFEALVWRSCRGSSRCFPPGFLSGKQFWSLWVLYHVISCIFHALKQPCLVVQWLTIILSISHKCFTVNIIEHTKIHSFLSSYRLFCRQLSPLECCDQIHPFCCFHHWTGIYLSIYLSIYIYIMNIYPLVMTNSSPWKPMAPIDGRSFSTGASAACLAAFATWPPAAGTEPEAKCDHEP